MLLQIIKLKRKTEVTVYHCHNYNYSKWKIRDMLLISELIIVKKKKKTRQTVLTNIYFNSS